MDVLQAVHLLLAYPLFAVVVGVDQRCLKQSLRIRFQGLLTPMEKHESGEPSLLDRDEPAATPLDYLEKIFHIPFHLPPMAPDGFQYLIQELTKPPAEPGGSKTHKEAGYREPSLPLNQTGGIAAEGEKEPDTSVVQDMAAIAGPRLGSANAKTAPSETVQSPVDAPASAPTLGSVPLYAWECVALQKYSFLIQTPRGAKRFLNTYRLVRAGLTEQEWDRFRELPGGPQEFRLAMLFLAAAAGQPSVARDWFSRIRIIEADDLPSDPRPGDNPRAWKAFCDGYNLVRTDPAAHFSVAQREKWLSRVERFTF